jgi:hypothetical protein
VSPREHPAEGAQHRLLAPAVVCHLHRVRGQSPPAAHRLAQPLIQAQQADAQSTSHLSRPLPICAIVLPPTPETLSTAISSDQRSMIACRLPTCFSRAAGHRVPLRNGNLAGFSMTRSVGDISHNARLTHTADRTESAPDGGQPLSLHAYGGGQSFDVVRLVMPLTVDEEGRRA